MNLVEKHFRNSEKLLRSIDTNTIAQWLLNEGYFPEQYVLPPTFKVNSFNLEANEKITDLSNPARREIIPISYPKSLLTSREFGIQHPNNYHDIVYWITKEWNTIIEILYNQNQRIYSYSFPIPIDARNLGKLSSLRSGRMIYEWIAMAEKDLVAEAHRYNHIVRSDITNFYNSIYTHSIAWAIHGQEIAFADKNNSLVGNKIDRLVQYANNGRTNGLPVGSALSDLIAEIILSSIDLEVSKIVQEKRIDFLATRFKDDYRILCNNKTDAEFFLKTLANELKKFNLSINENKTVILDLPSGLYRHHDRLYNQHSLAKYEEIDFKTFELTLLKTLDIHREFPNTSILEKFFSELFDNKNELKIKFSNDLNGCKKQILKTFSLLMLVKRESEKVLCHILAVIEALYLKFNKKHNLKEPLVLLINSEIIKASKKKSVFELVWLVFFSRYMKLGIKDLSKIIEKEELNNQFLKSTIESKQKIFNDSGIKLYKKPSDCNNMTLAKRLAVFERNKKE